MMTLKDLEDIIKVLRENGATDEHNVAIYTWSANGEQNFFLKQNVNPPEKNVKTESLSNGHGNLPVAYIGSFDYCLADMIAPK